MRRTAPPAPQSWGETTEETRPPSSSHPSSSPPSSSPPSSSPPKVGGPGGQHPHFSGWSILGVAGTTLFCSQLAQTPVFGVFVDPMREEFGWSRSAVSSIYTAAILLGAGLVLLAGRLIDRHGHRRVMFWSATAFALSLVAMGAVYGTISLFLALVVLRLGGGSILSLAARTLVSTWFARRRGRAISLLNLGKMLGVAVLPPIMALLVESGGWRNAWRIGAVIVAVTLIPATLRWVWGRPEQIGQFPDGIRPETPAGQAAETGDDGSWTLAQARRTRVFWLLVAATAIPALITNGLAFSQVSIFTDQGLSTAMAATTFTVESIVAVPVSLLAGWMADRFGARYVLAIGNGALVLAMAMLAVTGSFGFALIYAALKAITAGTWVLGSEACWPAYFGSRHLGSIVGVNFAITSVFVALGPLPFSLAYDLTGGYDTAIWGLAILPALTMVAALMAVPPLDRRSS